MIEDWKDLPVQKVLFFVNRICMNYFKIKIIVYFLGAVGDTGRPGMTGIMVINYDFL